MMKKFKLFNIRTFVVIALSQIIGIYFASYFPSFGVWARIIPVIVLTAVFVPYIIFCPHEKRLVACVTAVIGLAMVFIGGTMVTDSAKKVELSAVSEGNYRVKGVVDYISYNDGKYNVRLTECFYNDIPAGNIAIYGVDKRFSICEIIEFDCDVTSSDILFDGRYSSYVYNRVSNIAGNVTAIKTIGIKKTVRYFFGAFVNDKCSAMSENSRNITFGLICGDTSFMEYKTDIYRATGIAHVFAVSGMHVGLLCAFLSFVLKPLPINRAWKSLLTICMIVTYSWVCGFSASSLRAAIICSVYLIVGIVYEKKDSLSALAIASLVVLSVDPFDLFGVGYILSFSLCLSLMTLAPAISARIGGKSEKLSGNIGMLIAAEAVAIPLSVKYFGSFPLVSAIANLLIVPAVSYCFYFAFAGLALSTFIPPRICMFLADNLLAGIDYITSFLAGARASITIFPTLAMLIYYCALIISSDIVHADVKVKRVSAGVAIIIVFCMLLWSSF